MEDVKPEIMKLSDVAQYLRVCNMTVYRWATKGKIPGFKLGGSWRFKRSVIDAWTSGKQAS